MPASLSRRRLAGASIGNFVELYDFFLYGLSAPVLAVHFFPEADPTTAMLSTFAVYAVAFFARPLGGVLFGYLSDRRGRVYSLMLTVLLMGAGTMLTGLLPAYTTIGIAAPLLLVLCRLMQGLSHGGESSGSYSFVIESAPDGQRARWVSAVACFAILPAAVAGIFILVLRLALGGEAYTDWGWRIPFLVGGVLAVIGLWLRWRLDDPEEFKEATREEPVSNPLLTVVKRHVRALATVTLLVSVQAVSTYMLLGYMYHFLVEEAGLDDTAALLSNAAAITVVAALLPVFGIAADRVGRKPVLFCSAGWLLLTAYPAFSLAANGTLAGAYAGQLLLAVGSAMAMGAGFVTMLELFPTAVRGTGHAISYNLGNALFGGTAPLIATALTTSWDSPIAPAFYVMAVAVAGLIVFALMPETRNVRLRSAGNAPTPPQPLPSESVKD